MNSFQNLSNGYTYNLTLNTFFNNKAEVGGAIFLQNITKNSFNSIKNTFK